jgi:hypothetical protein
MLDPEQVEQPSVRPFSHDHLPAHSIYPVRAQQRIRNGLSAYEGFGEG